MRCLLLVCGCTFLLLGCGTSAPHGDATPMIKDVRFRPARPDEDRKLAFLEERLRKGQPVRISLGVWVLYCASAQLRARISHDPREVEHPALGRGNML